MPIFRIKKSKVRKYFALCFLLALICFNSAKVWSFNAYSNRDLDELEKEFVFQIQQSSSVVRDPLCDQYINHVGRKLSQSAKMTSPYYFIVRSSEINAFAGPGGYIGINTQLILTSDNANELAAVMAHELAHVRQHHLYYMLEHQKHMRIPMLASMLASIALGVINPTLGSGAMMASLTGIAQDQINFIRSNEKDADRIGIDYLHKAGYNPSGMIEFFKKMEAATRFMYSDNVPAILRTHPLDKDRIAEAEDRVDSMKHQTYPVDEDYYYFKERIRNFHTKNDKQILNYYQNQCKKSKHNAPCLYGYSIALMNNQNAAQAKTYLQQLLQQQPNNVYFKISLSEAEAALKEDQSAVGLLEGLFHDYPDNYAILMFYTKQLVQSGKNKQALPILIKASRKYKNSLPLCNMLAQTESNVGHKSMAYFTSAQCMLLEGRHRAAVQQLKVAKNYAKNDKYMKARISAKIDEIKFLMSK